MEFTLVYDGPLATNGRPLQKHDIRLHLHPQLSALWTRLPLSQNVVEGNSPTDTAVGDHVFRTIVHPRWSFQADLRIILLQPRPPGGIINAGGDIDNRLKTLFDALARPMQAQDIPRQWEPGPGEQPVCCLLEDDSLIKRISVDTDELLAPQSPSHVKLFIGVRIQTAKTALHGGWWAAACRSGLSEVWPPTLIGV